MIGGAAAKRSTWLSSVAIPVYVSLLRDRLPVTNIHRVLVASGALCLLISVLATRWQEYKC